jgi:hypothetical protein
MRASPGRGESGASQQRAPEHHPDNYGSASSTRRRRTESSGRSKATTPGRAGAYPDPHAAVQHSKGRLGDADSSSAVSIPLVEDGLPTITRGRHGWHGEQHSRTAASAQSSHVEATRARLKHESAQLARTKAQYDAMWDDMETEAAVLVQKNYRGHRGRQLALQEEEQMWREQEEEEQAAMREQLRWQQQQEEQEQRAERMRRAEVQRERTEEQRRIMDQRRRVREEAAEVEREFVHLQQVKLTAERQALATERQMLSEQRHKLAAAKQQTIRPSLERTEYRPMGDLTLEVAHSVETAAGNGATWPPTEGVPPSSPAVESRISSLEQQFSQVTDLLTSSSPSLQHKQHEHRRQHVNKQGTAAKVGSNLYTMPLQSARAPEPEPEPEPEPKPEHALQPVRASASTQRQQHYQPQGMSREYQLKRQQNEEKAAVLLQKTYRGYRGRQSADAYYEQLLLEQQEEDEAATKLQAAWRGSTTRREMTLMQDESPREKAWALFGGSGRGGSYAAQQAVSPRTQLARRNQFLRVGNSAGGSVLVGTTSQNDMEVRSSHTSDEYHSSTVGAGSQTTESTFGTVCPEDLFADADIAGDGVLIASQVREVLLDAAPELGRAAPPSDEAFISDLLQAFGKRYRIADSNLPANEVVIGLDIDAFCAMWDHITGSGTQHYDRADYDAEFSSAQTTTNSSFCSETEEEDVYDSQDFRDHSQVDTGDGAVEVNAQEAPATLSMPTSATASGTDQLVISRPPEAIPFEKNTTVAATAGNAGYSGAGDASLQALVEEGAAISIQAQWRGRRTANALSELRSMGMADADIRWMVQQGHHLPRG